MVSYSLKVDVDTHDGMRDGVPRLLDTFRPVRRQGHVLSGVRAGQLRQGDLESLPQQGVPQENAAHRRAEVVRLADGALGHAASRAADRGEVPRLRPAHRRRGARGRRSRVGPSPLAGPSRPADAGADRGAVRAAFECFEKDLGRRPRAVAAPAWYATATSLQVQDGLGLQYASDIRGGRFGYPELDGYRSTTLQLPTTQPCLEELLTLGRKDLDACAEAVLAGAWSAVRRHSAACGGRRRRLRAVPREAASRDCGARGTRSDLERKGGRGSPRRRTAAGHPGPRRAHLRARGTRDPGPPRTVNGRPEEWAALTS